LDCGSDFGCFGDVRGTGRVSIFCLIMN